MQYFKYQKFQHFNTDNHKTTKVAIIWFNCPNKQHYYQMGYCKVLLHLLIHCIHTYATLKNVMYNLNLLRNTIEYITHYIHKEVLWGPMALLLRLTII